jgi:hypothetical protein
VGDEYKVDRFEDLVFRNVASVGAGHVFSRGGGLDLWLEAGPAHISGGVRDGTSDTWLGARLAAHFRLELPFVLEIRDDSTLYPNFETWDDWQFHNEASHWTRVGSGWTLTLSVISDRDNEPVLGKESSDNSYVAGLGYRF